ncbi:MAG: type III-A CRISPR-associated RAMP protein Csm5 [Magnetococcales bacterium]|nr:type III-A CRISPR-associated RAMP protein Csm5 [Magnetococcales bacterium]
MAERFLQSHRLVISTLSPVHIGCGEDYEPTNYVIDDNNNTLHYFEPSDLLTLPQWPERRQELLNLVTRQGGSQVVRGIQTFFHKLRKEIAPLSRHQVSVSQGIMDSYKERIGQVAQREFGNKETLNSLGIQRGYYHPHSGQPILPGSSLKGAVRTALLNHAHGGQKLKQPALAEQRTNWKKLSPLDVTLRNFHGDFHADPLRLIKITDSTPFPTEKIKPLICFAVNRSKRPDDTKERPFQMRECLPGMAKKAVEAELILHDVGALRSEKLPAVRPTMEEIVKRCNDYYLHRLQESLKLPGVDKEWINKIQRSLDRNIWRLQEGDSFLLRLGMGSGSESITLDGARHIHQPQHRQWVEKPSTVWLFSEMGKDAREGLLPFGWVLVAWDKRP